MNGAVPVAATENVAVCPSTAVWLVGWVEIADGMITVNAAVVLVALPKALVTTTLNVALLSALVFAAGAGLAAFGGVMGGPILGGYTGIDVDLLPLAFVVVIVGGMGSLKGALVGSIVVGLTDNFGKALVPELSYFTLFAPMVVVLAIKPTGLYGRS